MTYNQEALEVVALAGKILLQNGAEIFRVEDTLTKLLDTFGITDYNFFVMSNAIFISVDETKDKPCYCIRHIELGSVHLERITAVNDLSRRVVAENSRNMEEIRAELKRCRDIPRKSKPMNYLANGMGAASFCYLLGGSLFDSLAALITGLCLQAYILLSAKSKQNKYIVKIIGSGWVTLCSHALFSMGVGDSLDNIIIGAIIPLVPGVAIVTAIRNYFNSNYLSGTINLIDAFLFAVCIAVGVGGAFALWGMLSAVGVAL